MDNIKIIKRVPSHYVGDDCLQEMVGYKDALMILSPEGVIYQDTNTENKINEYLNDERRHQFPYSNIPTHYQKVLFKKYLFINQILNFETPYLQLTSKGMFVQYALKNGKEGIIINETLMNMNSSQEKLLTRKEVESFFDYEDGKVFVFNNSVFGKLVMPTTEDILSRYRNFVSNVIDNNSQIESLTEKLISKLEIDDIPNNFDIKSPNNVILMIVGKAKEMELNFVDIKFMNEDSYKLILREIPITKYNLEQMKNFIVLNAKEPKINLGINPEITKEDINAAQQLILKKNK